MTVLDPRHRQLLDEINRGLPAGVDWKQGAIDYLRDLIADRGEEGNLYHLIKPFLGGPEYHHFYEDTFLFLDVLQKLDLSSRSRVLDVACGPGWTAHWMAKLGYDVVGLDISPDLLAVARERVATDPYPTFPGEGLTASFLEFDIEAEVFPDHEAFDAVLLESALHHFWDPVSALRNLRPALRDGGVAAIIEGARQSADSSLGEESLELMARYRTLERPYTRAQLEEILDLAGFPAFVFLEPLNGLFERTADEAFRITDRLRRPSQLNIVLAAADPAALGRIVDGFGEGGARTQFGAGFHNEERAPSGELFRWAEPRATMHLTRIGCLTVELGTMRAAPRPNCRIYADGALRSEVRGGGFESVTVRLEALDGVAELRFDADGCFGPSWGGGPDDRLLSFTVSLMEAG